MESGDDEHRQEHSERRTRCAVQHKQHGVWKQSMKRREAKIGQMTRWMQCEIRRADYPLMEEGGQDGEA